MVKVVDPYEIYVVVATSLFDQLCNVIAYVFSLTCASIFFAMLHQNQEQMWHIA
jgi:hypothetical protein